MEMENKASDIKSRHFRSNYFKAQLFLQHKVKNEKDDMKKLARKFGDEFQILQKYKSDWILSSWGSFTAFN